MDVKTLPWSNPQAAGNWIIPKVDVAVVSFYENINYKLVSHYFLKQYEVNVIFFFSQTIPAILEIIGNALLSYGAVIRD